MRLSIEAGDERLLRDRFAELLGTVRHHRKLSQEEVAYLAGIDVSTYRRIETRSREGHRLVSPRFDTVLKLVIALKIPSDEMSALFAETGQATKLQNPEIAALGRD